jgi:hypothetical protein
VKTALQVFAGNESVLSGSLREAIRKVSAAGEGSPPTGTDSPGGGSGARTNYVSGATDTLPAYLPETDGERIPRGVSFDLYEKVETAGATYFVVGGEVGVEIELRAPGTDVAKEIEDFTATLATFAEARIENRTVAEEFGKVEVSREEVVVTVVYRSDVEGAAALADWL